MKISEMLNKELEPSVMSGRGGFVSQGVLTAMLLCKMTFRLLDTSSLGVAEHTAHKAGQCEALLPVVALAELLRATRVRYGSVAQASTQHGTV